MSLHMSLQGGKGFLNDCLKFVVRPTHRGLISAYWYTPRRIFLIGVAASVATGLRIGLWDMELPRDPL